jgi:acetylornithine aminotransferase
LEVLKNAGVLSVFDEIQTFGRTTEPFCFQHLGLDAYADIVTVGKLTQACVTLIRAELKPGPGLISQTFTASTLSIRAGRAVLDYLEREGHFGPEGKNAKIRAALVRRLEVLAAKYPDKMAGPWGEGLMVAFTPLGGDPSKVKALLARLFDAGVIAFVAGGNPARARFLVPPGAVEEWHLDEVFGVLDSVLASS